MNTSLELLIEEGSGASDIKPVSDNDSKNSIMLLAYRRQFSCKSVLRNFIWTSTNTCRPS